MSIQDPSSLEAFLSTLAPRRYKKSPTFSGYLPAPVSLQDGDSLRKWDGDLKFQVATEGLDTKLVDRWNQLSLKLLPWNYSTICESLPNHKIHFSTLLPLHRVFIVEDFPTPDGDMMFQRPLHFTIFVPDEGHEDSGIMYEGRAQAISNRMWLRLDNNSQITMRINYESGHFTIRGNGFTPGPYFTQSTEQELLMKEIRELDDLNKWQEEEIVVVEPLKELWLTPGPHGAWPNSQAYIHANVYSYTIEPWHVISTTTLNRYQTRRYHTEYGVANFLETNQLAFESFASPPLIPTQVIYIHPHSHFIQISDSTAVSTVILPHDQLNETTEATMPFGHFSLENATILLISPPRNDGEFETVHQMVARIELEIGESDDAEVGWHQSPVTMKFKTSDLMSQWRQYTLNGVLLQSMHLASDVPPPEPDNQSNVENAGGKSEHVDQVSDENALSGEEAETALEADSNTSGENEVNEAESDAIHNRDATPPLPETFFTMEIVPGRWAGALNEARPVYTTTAYKLTGRGNMD